MNKYICNSKIVLFLGAGASDFLDKPLMANFIDELIDWVNDVNLKGILNTIVTFKGKDLEILLSEIEGIRGRDYFKHIDKWNYIKGILESTTLAEANLLATGFPGGETSYKSDFAERYEILCRDCRRLEWKIYDKIFEVYFDIDQMKTKKLYAPLFTLLKDDLSKNTALPIFTTNYDKAIEVFSDTSEGIELVDGFKTSSKTKTSTWGGMVFENFKPKKLRNYVVA